MKDTRNKKIFIIIRRIKPFFSYNEYLLYKIKLTL